MYHVLTWILWGKFEVPLLDGPQNPHSGNCPGQGFMSVVIQRCALGEAFPIMVGVRAMSFEGKL